MKNNIYVLPEINFVAGQSEKILWNVYNSNKQPFDGSDCVVNFAIVNYSNRTEVPLVSKDLGFRVPDNVDENDDLIPQNVILVQLDPADTLQLEGKYIYQLTIVNESTGEVSIPYQGIMMIYKNINKPYLTE